MTMQPHRTPFVMPAYGDEALSPETAFAGLDAALRHELRWQGALPASRGLRRAQSPVRSHATDETCRRWRQPLV